ncbi:kinase-like domain-containing protein [Lentinula detonsa]|uniref:Kinase-like domain-containing protein n=1 Tax=Lentinula detonsa TaxID=2804962 RepID=A0AA38UW45_9AGAR|nr:kinase-like domain-containing protein [Lentinula detonsa]
MGCTSNCRYYSDYCPSKGQPFSKREIIAHAGPQVQTSSSPHKYAYTDADRSNDSERTLQPIHNVGVLTPPPSPVYPSFQWIRGDLIGEGSFGRVYWALNVTTGDIIAVKQVELARNPSRHEKASVEALKFESYTLKDLDHPNIVQFLGFEESTNHLSIFMEYVAGGTIGSCLKAHGRFNDEVTKAFTRQMLEGLEYLHSRGIIHRDIKADNILVDKSGVCKISDFGISKQAQGIDGRAFTEMRGTVYWMAPEAVNPKETDGYDAKIDIWSIGCVVLEMWTGRRPWYGEEQYPVIFKLYNNKLPPPVPVDLILSDEAMDFRERAFARDPKERASAAVLRSHPYLVMKPGWIFKSSYIERPVDGHYPEPTMRHSKSYSAMADKTVRRIRSNKALPPVPTSSAPSVVSSPRVHPDVNSSSPSSLSPSNSAGPPIVVIHPLRSPANSQSPQLQLHIHEDSISSPSTTSSSRWSSRRKRSFYVTNPDNFDHNRKPFIYHPPPLPVYPINRHTRSNLTASLHSQNHHSPRRVPSTPVLNTQTTVSSSIASRSKHASSVVERPVFDYSDDVNDAGSSGTLQHPQSPKGKWISAWGRPYVEDIYEHLQQFFPHHDIDQPIANEAKSDSQDRQKDGLQPKKSIRMVAEQRVIRSDSLVRKSRRATKLWGSHLEELGGTKS